MRRFLSLATLFICVALNAQYRTPDYSDLSDSEAVKAFKEHVGYIASSAMEGRKAGSEGENAAAEYFAEKLSSYGVDVISNSQDHFFGIKRQSGDTLTSRNVVGVISGYDKELKDRYIVIGARLDNLGSYDMTVDGQKVEKIYYGANGNASGLAMLLELAKRIQAGSLMIRRSVVIVAFGASAIDNAGAWYFLNRSFADADKIDAMVNLDMVGTANGGFYAYTSGNADLSALVESVNGSLQPIKPELVNLEPCVSVHQAFYSREIPSVMFTTGMYPQYNSDKDTPSILEYEDMEREMEYLYNFCVQLANGPRPVFSPADEVERKKASGEDVVIPYYQCDVKPVFLASRDPRTFLEKWVYVYLRYPDECVRKGIQGRVQIDFIIDERGKLTSARVTRGLHPLLDEEVLRVVNASPDWKPGRLRGQKVKCEMSMYVEFKLKKN